MVLHWHFTRYFIFSLFRSNNCFIVSLIMCFYTCNFLSSVLHADQEMHEDMKSSFGPYEKLLTMSQVIHPMISHFLVLSFCWTHSAVYFTGCYLYYADLLVLEDTRDHNIWSTCATFWYIICFFWFPIISWFLAIIDQ